MIKPDEFLNLMSEDKKEKNIRFGIIDPSYTTGRPTIIFDGMDNPSAKQFPYAASYTPAANDRVLIISGVVICKIL